MDLTDLLGYVAAICTTGALLPQVLKTVRTRSTGDLSLRMALLLFGGGMLWLIYGIVTGDAPIIAANVVGVAFTGIILFYKFRHG